MLAHYLLERQLSDQLRAAPREHRVGLYTSVYSELFQALPDHPQRWTEPSSSTARVDVQLRWFSGELRPDSRFLEIGCGNAALSCSVAAHVDTAYGLDVTDTLIDFALVPPNFTYLQTIDTKIPLPSALIDLAYSNQVMEHLHPDDAIEQLAEVYRVLKPGGQYICITPSRVTGPHDISGYFDYEATGLHLREYDYGALRALFSRVGFRYFSCCAMVRGRIMRIPYAALRAAECILSAAPDALRARLTGSAPVHAMMGLNVIATK